MPYCMVNASTIVKPIPYCMVNATNIVIPVTGSIHLTVWLGCNNYSLNQFKL